MLNRPDILALSETQDSDVSDIAKYDFHENNFIDCRCDFNVHNNKWFTFSNGQILPGVYSILNYLLQLIS